MRGVLFNNGDCCCLMSNSEFHKQFDLETTVGLPHCRPLTDSNHRNLKRFKMHFYKSQIEVSFNKAYFHNYSSGPRIFDKVATAHVTKVASSYLHLHHQYLILIRGGNHFG